MNNSSIKQSQTVFGEVVYWLTVISAIFCTIGPVVAFLYMDGNVLNLHYLFTNMWAGMDPGAIWGTAEKASGEAYYQVYNMSGGDGLIQLGLIIGCSIALPAMLVAAIIYVFKEKSLGWALGAIWIVGLVAISILGIVSV